MDVNPFLERIRQRGLLADSTDSASTTHDSLLKECGLDNLHCEDCGDSGVLTRKDENGVLWSRECPCMKRRRSIRNIEKAGLTDLVKRCTFDNYQTPTQKHEVVKQMALNFCQSDTAAFLICGQSGSGKTHICVSIFNEIVISGKSAQFFQWRHDAPDMKTIITADHEKYKEKMERLKAADCLYIDDFLKGSITPADINLAFTIINDRYNDSWKKTVVSTELTPKQLLEADEAVGGRLLEMAKGFVIEAPQKNLRLSKT